MTEARTSPPVLLSGFMGFALGGAILAFAELLIGTSLLAHADGGVHSDWTIVVFFGALACFGVGGVAGARGALRLVKSRIDRKT